jgi:hypothetical protein
MTGDPDEQRGAGQRHAIHEHGPARLDVQTRRHQRRADRAHRAGHPEPSMPFERARGVDEGCRREQPPVIAVMTPRAAPALTFATAIVRQAQAGVVMAASSATAAASTKAIGKCTNSG